MKKLYVLVASLAAMCAFAAISVMPASATEWLLNGAAIASAVSVDSQDIGSILLQDHGAFTEPDILCTETDEGTAGPGAADTETSLTVASCVTDSGECKNPTVKAIHLSWKTELVLVGTEIRDYFKNNGAGAPGYDIICETFIGTLHDTCTSEELSAGFLDNNASGVSFVFNTAVADCTLGGTKMGLIEGTILILPLSGTLTVS